jgi:hypothetical protein
MPIIENIDFHIDVDHVLRAQGADPTIIRSRNKTLVNSAQQALSIGLQLLQPKVLYADLPIKSVQHEKILLENGQLLSGKLVSRMFASAQRVALLLCTIGPQLEEESQKLITTNPVLGLALEGVGSASVEALANAACKHFEDQARVHGFKVTFPLSPGMIQWPVEQGQPQFFSILESEKIGVQLAPSYIMLPRKSLTMALGIGADLTTEGSTCDFCMMRDTCNYKHHYPSEI